MRRFCGARTPACRLDTCVEAWFAGENRVAMPGTGPNPGSRDMARMSAYAKLRYQNRRNILDLSAWQAKYTQQRWREVLETRLEEEAFGRRLQEASRRGRSAGRQRV